MPRFFFHLRTGAGGEAGENGLLSADLQKACFEARRSIAALAGDS